jgi:hypothetical protein
MDSATPTLSGLAPLISIEELSECQRDSTFAKLVDVGSTIST